MNKKLLTPIAAAVIGLTAVQFGYAANAEPSTSSKVEKFVDDATITTSIKASFAKDDLVRATAISVETKEGVVMLSGTGKSLSEKLRAEEIAKSTKGVKAVQNNVKL